MVITLTCLEMSDNAVRIVMDAYEGDLETLPDYIYGSSESGLNYLYNDLGYKLFKPVFDSERKSLASLTCKAKAVKPSTIRIIEGRSTTRR